MIAVTTKVTEMASWVWMLFVYADARNVKHSLNETFLLFLLFIKPNMIHVFTHWKAICIITLLKHCHEEERGNDSQLTWTSLAACTVVSLALRDVFLKLSPLKFHLSWVL